MKCTDEDVFCWLWEGLHLSLLKTKTMSELRSAGSKPLSGEGGSGGRTGTVRMPSFQLIPAEPQECQG